ncbi:MAG: hypothetical protein KIH01_02695 [Candidatus Freyarchaeota archaeon]|nr:hypothetical protein [Candidatus Jordarchaeia archaeon]
MTGKALLAALIAALVVGAVAAGAGATAAGQQLQVPINATQSLPEMTVTWSTLTGNITNEAKWEVNAGSLAQHQCSKSTTRQVRK